MVAAALWLLVAFAAAELGRRVAPLHDGALWLPALWLLLSSRQRVFACLVPATHLAAWRDPAAWPQQAALLAMLPMMAALPAMADWCSAGGLSPPWLLLLHAAAMLLPPLLLPSRPGWIGALLVGGGLALWLLPGLQGLTAAMLLHGSAWSLARAQPRRALPPSAPVAWALALPVIGLALAQIGPQALVAVHGALALCGVAALATMARRHNPAHGRATHRHP